MPKIVDHEQRRRELAEAVWQVIVRDGVAGVSIRTVAAAAGWSSGALRHYLTTRAELLAFACERVIDQVTERIMARPPGVDPRAEAEAVLLETMPLDPQRRVEVSIAFSFLALGLGDPELARIQRLHFTRMYELCLRVCRSAAVTTGARDSERDARRLHALVDGLSVQMLAEHLTAAVARQELSSHLDELFAPSPAEGARRPAGRRELS